VKKSAPVKKSAVKKVAPVPSQAVPQTAN
jgi:hypothetical protein